MTSRRAAMAALLACAVTLAIVACADGPPNVHAHHPSGYAPPGEPASDYYYDRLLAVLWPNGEIIFEPEGPGEIRADGSLAMKFPFWTAAVWQRHPLAV